MRAFGYTRTNEVDEHEAAIVRELANRVLLGEPLQSLVTDLHDRQVPTSNGGKWDRATIRLMLKNPRIAGLPVGIRGRRVPPILAAETFTKVIELLDAPERRVQPIAANRRQYLMVGGHLVCGRCSKPMGPKGGAMPAYCCISRYPVSGCGRMRIVADQTDLAVTAAVLARIALPESRKAILAGLEAKHGGPARMEELRGQIATAREAGEPAGELSEQLRLLRDEWALVANMQDWFADLANMTARKLAEWWHYASLEHRQMLLAHMVELVKVQPVGRIGRYAQDGVAERLEFVWR